MSFLDRFKKDTTIPVENPKLLAAWEAYRASSSETNLSDFYEELCMQAQFLILTTTPITENGGENQTLTLTEDTPVNFALIQSEEKEMFFPLFTDWQQINKWTSAPSNQAFILSFDDLAALMAGAENVTGAALNPFDQNILLPRQLIARLKEQKDIRTSGHTQINVEKDTKIQLADVSPDAEPLKIKLREFFHTRPEVKAAWLKMMKRGEEISYLLVLDFDGEKEQLFPLIVENAGKHLSGYYLDMVPYSQTGFPGDALQGAEPFYQK